MKKRVVSRIFNRAYFVLLFLFLIIVNTPFEINHSVLKSAIYVGVLILTPALLVWDIYFYKPKLNKIYRILSPIIGFVVIFYLNPMEILDSSNVWNTEKVLFESKEDPNVKVEIQKQKMLTSSILKTRTVEVSYLTDKILKIKTYNKVNFDKNKWKKIQ
ncbi:hypothetical protein [Flavicella sediminum]|uniref:hypothetical protein n=1 Tax=Flavicella sediminum TaxID=2585141 RepID=UPI0011221F22|nr:hypothetical protein [Flavicella sediminum]